MFAYASVRISLCLSALILSSLKHKLPNLSGIIYTYANSILALELKNHLRMGIDGITRKTAFCARIVGVARSVESECINAHTFYAMAINETAWSY